MIDFNIHLPLIRSAKVTSMIEAESNLNVSALVDSLGEHGESIGHLHGANFMLFNQQLFAEEDIDLAPFISSAQLIFSSIGLTALVPFRNEDIVWILDRMVSCGVGGIKYHSYVQRISDTDFNQAVKVAELAEKRGLWICIDASYGTVGMYNYDNLKLAAAIASRVENVPIIILHSGGLRAIEAMLLALDRSNIYLETSFSLIFYRGSRVSDDMAYVYKKLGADRLLYASDYPYVDILDNEELQKQLFEKIGFSQDEMEQIFKRNALKLFAGRGV